MLLLHCLLFNVGLRKSKPEPLKQDAQEEKSKIKQTHIQRLKIKTKHKHNYLKTAASNILKQTFSSIVEVNESVLHVQRNLVVVDPCRPLQIRPVHGQEVDVHARERHSHEQVGVHVVVAHQVVDVRRVSHELGRLVGQKVSGENEVLKIFLL